MRKEKSIGAIVFSRAGQGKRFLLLRYASGHWDFPKGHLEKGETEKEAMLRELGEETGITSQDVAIVPGFKERIRYFFRSQSKLVSKEVVFFLVESAKTEVKLSFEHKSYKWLHPKQAIEKATFKTAKQLLKRADASLKQ